MTTRTKMILTDRRWDSRAALTGRPKSFIPTGRTASREPVGQFSQVRRPSNAAPIATPTPAPTEIPTGTAQPPKRTPIVSPIPAPMATPMPVYWLAFACGVLLGTTPPPFAARPFVLPYFHYHEPHHPLPEQYGDHGWSVKPSRVASTVTAIGSTRCSAHHDSNPRVHSATATMSSIGG
jgi:hypothetical protein